MIAVGSSSDHLLEIALTMGVSLFFSLLLGVWISRVIDQSRGRAELIQELEATRAELAEAHHAQGVTAERERFAREIHDTLAQGFTSVVMLSQAAAAQLSRDPAAVADQLAAIERTARENLAEARAVVAAFSPVALEGTDLAGCPATAGRAIHRRDRHRGRRRARGEEVEPGRWLATARSCCCVRRRRRSPTCAGMRDARRVTIRLRLDDGAAEVEVSDDGSRVRPASVHGFGLSGMRGRVQDIGGDMAS